MEEETDLNGSLSPLQEDLELNINAQDKFGNTHLHKAIDGNQEALVDALLLKNVNIEIKNNEGETPLMVAVKSLNEIFVEKLIKKGAKIDCEDEYYNTPLIQAVLLNLENIVDLLLKNGATCCVENENSKTPLHLAIVMNFESIFDKLIKAGADVNIVNGTFGTPIQAALTSGNLSIARKLLAAGASLTPSSVFSSLLNCYKDNVVILFDFISENGFDINAKGCENWSLLHLAVIRPNEKIVKNLLKEGAEVNAKDNLGETPLHFSVKLSSSVIVKLLLEHKAHVNARNKNGETPLHIAVNHSSREGDEIVRLLLNAGADMNVTKNCGSSPLDLLTRFSSRKVISYLLCARKMDLAKVRSNITQNDGTFPKNFTTVEAFGEKCLEELGQMKEKKFNSISLYNIFSECNDPVFASNSNMGVYLKSETLQRNFPIYARLLRKKFIEGMKRNILLDEISISVRIMKCLNEIHLVLPYELSRKVLVYLEDCDLLNLKRAYYHTSNQQRFQK